MAPFGDPQLNFREKPVIEKFSKVISEFLVAGVSGIRLTGAPYLLVDEGLREEKHKYDSQYTIGQYGFYKHNYTMNLKELGPLLKTWHDMVKSFTSNGPFFLSEDLSTLEPYRVNNSLIIDLPRSSKVFARPISSGLQLKTDIDTAIDLVENYWPLWEVRIIFTTNMRNVYILTRKCGHFKSLKHKI